MCGFRWIPVCLFVVLAVDPSRPKTLDLYRRSGDTVSLPFVNQLPDADPGCDSTTWIYSQPDSAGSVTLAERGAIETQTGRLKPSKANRLSLETNCSLTVQDVTAEDVGYYVIRQFPNGRPRLDDQRVDLSVLAVSEVTGGNGETEGQTLQCSLIGQDASCGGVSVSWVDEDGNLLADNSQRPGCSTNLTIHTHHLTMKIKCQVTVSGEVKTFIDLPEVAQGDMMSTATPACSDRLHVVTLVVRVVGTVAIMVALTVTLVVISRRTKIQTRPATDPNAVTEV